MPNEIKYFDIIYFHRVIHSKRLISIKSRKLFLVAINFKTNNTLDCACRYKMYPLGARVYRVRRTWWSFRCINRKEKKNWCVLHVKLLSDLFATILCVRASYFLSQYHVLFSEKVSWRVIIRIRFCTSFVKISFHFQKHFLFITIRRWQKNSQHTASPPAYVVIVLELCPDDDDGDDGTSHLYY